MKVKIRFSEKREPLLRQGAYRITTKMESNVERGDGQRVAYSEETDVMLANRRFAWPAQTVYSVYPPANTAGEYGLCLPHIVLNHSTLPWEYALPPKSGAAESPPGLALLICAEDEGVKECTLRVSELTLTDGSARVHIPDTMRLSDADAEKDDEECKAIDVPARLFLDICPEAAELALLTHVKEVALDDKVTDPLVKAGRFACIVANRFPRKPVGGEKSVRHKAYLVSLREYAGFLQTGKDGALASSDYARLVCLADWAFEVTTAPYDFRSVIRRIDPDALWKKSDLSGLDAELQEVLRRGYEPLNHDFRDGSRSVSWYRGPLLPIVEQPAKPRYHVFSDELYGYDPWQGMFDVSYACAWQLGRMLALQNLSVCQETLKWRFQNCYDAARQNQQRDTARRVLREESAALDLKDALAQTCANALEHVQTPVRKGEENDEAGM